jgi:hypothetical protein
MGIRFNGMALAAATLAATCLTLFGAAPDQQSTPTPAAAA